MKVNGTSHSWGSIFLLTLLAAYLYVFNEWLFTVTKPSFMNDMRPSQQLQIFISVATLLAALCFLGLLPLALLSLIPPLKKYKDAWIKLGAWVPAAVFAALILMLVDNFTYTVFKFGVVSTDGWSRGLYAAAFIVVTILCYRSTLRALASLDRWRRSRGITPAWIFGSIFVLFILTAVFLLSPGQVQPIRPASGSTTGTGQRPHILWITSDGVSANHTSLYGYQRDTTPDLRELAESSLLAENVFANSDHSTGSIMSMYTSKYPDETRVFFAHNILKGEDSYEHLPGLLRAQGYKTVQITVPYYLDPNSVNLLDSFDEVRMTGIIHSKYLNKMSKILPSDKALFIDESLNRIADRMRHIFFIEKMNNPQLLAQSDIERWQILKQEIHNAQQPLFVHIHLVVTHGKRFNPVEQVYSAGRSIQYQEPWNVDFYDDSIKDFDKNVGELVEDLTARGLLDKTVLIIGSDHSQQWNQRHRIPLLIRFPHGEHTGRIQANVQNLDIAPTILDYIDLEIPAWMRGRSLLEGELEQRPLFNVAGLFDGPASDTSGGALDEKLVTTVDGIRNVTLVYCRNWYTLDFTNMSLETGEVEGSTTSCTSDQEISNEQAIRWIVEHLEGNGYEIPELGGDILSK